MLKLIKAIFLRIKNFFSKHVSLAEALYQEFVNSEEGKKLIEELKNALDKNASIQSILTHLTEKAKVLAENNPKLTQKVLEFLKKKILVEFK